MKQKTRRRIIEFDERLSDEAKLLNRYLYQYSDCIGKKKALERRRDEIRREFYPVKSPKLDGMPRSEAVGEGSTVALVYRLDEIDEKIRKEINRTVELLSDIMDIIDLIPDNTPENSLARAIIENRYIDRMSWEMVCRENHCSKSKTSRYWKKGLYTLLGFKKVKKILSEYYKDD